MVPVSELYRRAEAAGIEVLSFPLPIVGSLALAEGAARYVALDPSVCDGGAGERVRLAHETGHCATDSFYPAGAPAELRRRCENRADRWAIAALIPLRELRIALSRGITEVWELADYFGVTEDFMRKALCLYFRNNLAPELYAGQ